MSDSSPAARPSDPVRVSFKHSVVVLHAPSETSIGARIVVDGVVSFGRGAEGLPPDAAFDRLLSRKHAKFSSEGTVFEVEDCGSSNGTFVNGERVQKAALAAGDVVEVGEFALIVDPAFPRRERKPHPRIVGASEAISSHVEAIENLSGSERNVVLHGPAGSGKSLAAQELHRASRRKGALVVVSCDRPGEIVRVVGELLRDDGSLADAFGGSLVLDSIDRARTEDLRKLPSVFGLSRERGIRVVMCSRRSAMDLSQTREEYAQLVSGTISLEVPALDARREDIPLLVRHFFASLGDDAPEVTREFVAKLVRGGVSDDEGLSEEQAVLARAMGKTVFPDNVRGLFAQLDVCLGLASIGGDLSDVDQPGDDDDDEPPPEQKPAKVARDGTFVQVGRERVHLRGRKALKSILAALVESALSTPWEAVPVGELFAKAWPDETVDGLSSAARVYLAISTLRRVGLEGHVERTCTGYRLIASADLEIVEKSVA